MSDFDDESTPPRGKHRPLTDSERQVFRAHYESGVPSVRQHEDADTSPIDLFRRASYDTKHGIVEELRRDPKKLIPFLGEFVEWCVGRLREQSSSEQEARQELRELLSKPPNGETRRLKEQVAGLERTVSELVEAIEAIQTERASEAEKAREAEKAATAGKWKAIIAIVTTVLGSAGAVIATVQSASEEKGRAKAEAATMRRDIDELRAAKHENRHDYDWDIAPRPEPRHQKKDNEP